MSETPDRVTVAVAAKKLGIPGRTIRAWAQPTADRPPLIQKHGHLVSLAELTRVREEQGYQPRKRAKASKEIKPKDFAAALGRTVSTIYDWRKKGVIRAYTESELERMRAAIAEKEAGGLGLEEQAAHERAAEENGGADGRRVATPGEVNYAKLQRLERENAVANGLLYDAEAAQGVVEGFARAYRESVDRLAVEVPRVTVAALERAGQELQPHVREAVSNAVQGAVLADAPTVDAALETLREAAKRAAAKRR